jgi:hypothetical protein
LKVSEVARFNLEYFSFFSQFYIIGNQKKPNHVSISDFGEKTLAFFFVVALE